jgi:predicted metal-dependent phosphoesterase TrpH
LSRGKPAFVPRDAAPPAEVITRIHDAGGIVSLAHPGVLEHDDWIRGLADSGLDAIEAYHSDHDHATTARYLRLAEQMGLAVSGGSDFHADEAHGPAAPGAVSLPRSCFEALEARARRRRA